MTERVQFLSDDDLARCSPRSSQGGQVLRAFCPFHGSDHQRSLRVTSETGRFECFSCGAWGYLESARRQLKSTLSLPRPRLSRVLPVRPASTPAFALKERGPAGLPVVIERYWQYQTALAGSPGETYLIERGIPIQLAKQVGIGYCRPGLWLNPAREWKGGRLVFAHTTHRGEVVNLYGRAVGSEETIPRSLRHDHLPGAKAFFNGRALRSRGPLYVCEGAFDALALLAAGAANVVAIFGLGDWRWELARESSTIIIALDADGPGQRQAQSLAREGARLGKRVLWLEQDDYGGHKDPSAAWRMGTLRLPEDSLAMR